MIRFLRFGILGSIAMLLLGAQGSAQSSVDVFPESLRKVEGQTSTSIPFGLKGQVLMQCLYAREKSSLPRTWKQLSFRADWGGKTSSIARKQWLRISVSMAATPKDSWTMSRNFVENQGSGTWKQVVSNLNISLPAQPKTLSGPRPFNLTIKFSKPYTHDWDDGRLLIELAISQQPSGSYPIDTAFRCDSKVTRFGTVGPKCRVQHKTGAKELGIESIDSVKAGGLFRYSCKDAAPDAPCLFFIGGALPPSGMFMGSKLPVSLVSKGFPAPDCYFNTDWIGIRAAVASKSGTAGISFPVPPNRKWIGSYLACQAATVDPAANPLGLVFSKGIRTTICGPLPVARLFATGDNQAKSGVIQRGAAPVIELR